MRFSVLGGVVACLLFSAGFGSGQTLGSAITLTSSTTNGYVVPKERMWKIEGLTPWSGPVGTHDLRVNGVAFIGASRETTIGGQFEININRPQEVPIWLGPETQVGVGDSRGKLVVREFPAR